MSEILILNSGSSSLKFALGNVDKNGGSVSFSVRGSLSGIGAKRGKLETSLTSDKTESRSSKKKKNEKSLSLPSHSDALKEMEEWLEQNTDPREISAVGHRIVHGGSRHKAHGVIDDAMISDLESLVPFAPSHLPQSLETVSHARKLFPKVPHVACFDTVFHRSMPEVTRVLPLPYSLFSEGVEKFGFHGLSYEYICSRLEALLGEESKRKRVIIAHLGNGCSLAAVESLRSVDTTMGFSPAGGLVMSTRCGDIDPGIVPYLIREKSLSVDDFIDFVNKKSGLLGISGISSDVRTLMESNDERAALALEIFIRQVAKLISGLASSLGGLDLLVFTAGIGENSPEMRSRISSRLSFLGIELDEGANRGGEGTISSPTSNVQVMIIPTDEESMIARHTNDLCRSK